MNVFTHRQRMIATIGVFFAVALVASGIWFFVRGGGSATPVLPASPGVSPSTTPASISINIYFHRGQAAEPRDVVAVQRTVPKTTDVAAAALAQLLAGPTAAERAAGFWSHFSTATASMLRGVRVANGVACVDFRDFSRIIPNASSSAGSAALLAELDATVKQFGTVRTTVYSFDGDIDAFYEWLQMVAPVGRPAGLAEARRVAAAFLTTIAGMRSPAYQTAQWRSDFIATADFRPRPGGGPVTTVTLGGGATSFAVLWAGTDTIKVDVPRSVVSPSDLQVVASPLTVSGQALAFEGTVNVRVVQVSDSGVRELGTGYVTGGGDIMRPFSGQISFARPTARIGWVVFTELSARDGEVTKTTAVKVAFAGVPSQPEILGVSATASPALADLVVEPGEGLAHNGWVRMRGTGTITFTVRTSATSQVRFYLRSLSSATAPAALLGSATRSGNIFTYTWRYANEPLLAQLSIEARNTNESIRNVAVNVFHS